MSVLDPKSQENIDGWKEIAKTLVNEDPSLTDQRIEELKELLKTEPNLRIPDEREFYVKFLRAGLNDPKSSFEIIKNFFTLRTKGNYFKVKRTVVLKLSVKCFLIQECNKPRRTGQDDIQQADSFHASPPVRI